MNPLISVMGECSGGKQCSIEYAVCSASTASNSHAPDKGRIPYHLSASLPTLRSSFSASLPSVVPPSLPPTRLRSIHGRSLVLLCLLGDPPPPSSRPLPPLPLLHPPPHARALHQVVAAASEAAHRLPVVRPGLPAASRVLPLVLAPPPAPAKHHDGARADQW